jgi:carbamoyltransferase
MRVLGLSAFYHDSAAALVVDGDIVAAAQEERFTRKKHDQSFPINAITYCLDEAGIAASELDHIVFYDKPFLKFERLVETYLAFAPRGFSSFRRAIPLWLREKLFQKNYLRGAFQALDPDLNIAERLLFSEHHMSHAASAYFASPFDQAAVLTMDGVGEWTTCSLGVGQDNKLEIIKEILFPHSIGLLYSAFTYYIGFKVNSGEYKAMGLAPYGEPKYAQLIYDNLIDVKDDGSFHLNMDYFDFCTGLRMTSNAFHKLFGGLPREPGSEINQRHMDLAASIQEVTEDVVLRLGQFAAKETKAKNLCLAGGVALNCVANGKLLRSNCFDEIWVQPAAGDAGGALGAALSGYHLFAGHYRPTVVAGDRMQGSYLGPRFNEIDIADELEEQGAKYVKLSDDALFERTGAALQSGAAVGWFQGRMEFGPRALGNRSILGDPRSKDMQSILNLKVKFRESFRPFAPAVMKEHSAEWFDLDEESPYMLFVADVAERHCRPLSSEEAARTGFDRLKLNRSDIPATTHVDGSARIQTVDKEKNPRFHALLNKFYEKTGCPVLINTSFNVRGEPIVCSPKDAFHCFMGTDLDVLVIENFFLSKDDQDPALIRRDYTRKFELD